MLKKMKINNFKSLVNFEIKFGEKFQAIIGPNNSGKTNIIDAINFISTLANRIRISDVYKSEDGFDRILHYNAQNDSIFIELEVESEFGDFIYKLDFSRNSISNELLIHNKKNEVSVHQGKGDAYDHLEKKSMPVSLEPGILAINQLWDNVRYPSIRKFSEILNKYKVYKLTPLVMRELTHVRKEFDPNINGEKLIQVLHSLLSSEVKTFMEVVEIMKTTFAEIEDINSTIDHTGLTNIEIMEKGFVKSFDVKQISDGTLRFLAFLTIIHLQKEYYLLCFEEPELYFHPNLLDKLISLLKNLDIQVIVTTHSPQLLNLLEPEDLIIITKKDGKTFCDKLPTKPEILKKLKDDGFLLGELWTMGEFDNA
jgi:predicted ATPase